MDDDVNAAPDNSAQAAVTPDNPGSPPEGGAQDPKDSPSEQTPVTDDKAGSTEEPAAIPEPPTPEPDPFWKQEGFRSEEAFLHAYKEGRSQLGKVHREAGSLKRANDIYRKHANGELGEDVNIEEYIAEENKRAEAVETERTRTNELANKEALLAVERFTIRHSDLNLTQEDINDIVSLAATSRSTDYMDRMEHGLGRFQRLKVAAKTKEVKAQQAQMKKGADLGPGSSGNSKPSDALDYKNMSSEDFAKIKQDIARG